MRLGTCARIYSPTLEAVKLAMIGHKQHDLVPVLCQVNITGSKKLRKLTFQSSYIHETSLYYDSCSKFRYVSVYKIHYLYNHFHESRVYLTI